MDAFGTLAVTGGAAGCIWNRWPAQWLTLAAALSMILLGVYASAHFGHAMAMAAPLLAVWLFPPPRHLLTACIVNGCRLLFQSLSKESHQAWLGSSHLDRRGLLASRHSCQFIHSNGAGLRHRSDPAACQPQLNFIADLEDIRAITNSDLQVGMQYQFHSWEFST